MLDASVTLVTEDLLVNYKSVLLVLILLMDTVMKLVVIALAEVFVTILMVLALVSLVSTELDANIKQQSTK